LKLKFLLPILLLLFSACVGTIKDKSKKTTTSIAAKAEVSFDGVVDGGTISHNKVWVRFKPATGGSGSYSYLAYLNGSTTEFASMNGASAQKDSDGFIIMTIPNLNMFTSYLVNVRVYDSQYALYDANTKAITLWTADDFLPIFDGVMAVENMTGLDAMTSLKVRWNTAAIDPSAPFDVSYSVSGYNIFYSTSEEELWNILRSANQHIIDLTQFPNSGYKSITDASAREGVITGLTPGVKYYVAVRARDSSASPRYERNISIRSQETYTHQPIEFAGLTLASVPVDQRGFSQVNLSWNACVACGVYKVYAKPTTVDTGSVHPGTDNAYLIGTVSNLALTATTLGGLSKNTNYKIYMLACHDMTCGWDGTELDERDVKGRTSSIAINTTPPLAPFSIDPANPLQPDGEEGLTSLNLEFEVDKTRGYYSKLRIYQILNKDGDTTNLSGANFRLLSRTVDANLPYIDPSINTTPLDYTNNVSMVRVANLAMGQEYCFQVIPVIEYPDLDNPGEEIVPPLSNRTAVVCGTPEYVAPDFGATSLFPTCSNITATSLTLNWIHPPTKNVMTHYEVYSKMGADAFVFEGVDGAWNNHDAGDDYVLQQMTLETSNTLTIGGLVPNMIYGFGINSYYKPGPLAEPIRRIPSTAAATVYCTTALPNVDHGGWQDIFSVGPKLDGLIYAQKKNLNLSDEVARTASLVPEFILPDLKIPYEWDQRGTLAVAPENDYTVGADGGKVPESSTTGLVRLAWRDFQISGTGAYLADYYSEGVTGLGYHVYRIALNEIPSTDRPTGEDDLNWQDDIRNANNPNWDLATPLRFNIQTHNLSHILMDQSSHSIAYSSSTINLDVNNPLTISAQYVQTLGVDRVFEIVDIPPENGKTYFYKVVAVFGGIEADFNTNKRINVVRVISPPDNMALVHRWIANQNTCGVMHRGGPGANCIHSTLSNKLCCDPSLADGVCSDPDNNYRCQFNGFGSLVDLDDDGEPDEVQQYSSSPGFYTRYHDIGHDLLVDRFEMGCNFTQNGCNGGEHCIGTDDPNNTGVVPDDDTKVNVFFRKHPNEAGSHLQGWCYTKKPGEIWKWGAYRQVSDYESQNMNSAFTNLAYLPSLYERIQENGVEVCAQRTVELDGNDIVEKLPNKREAAAYRAWGNNFSAGTPLHTLSPSLSFHDMMYKGYWGTTRQGCSVAPSNAPNGDFLPIDLDTNYYPNHVTSAHAIYRTGSNGDNSTALCVSYYGLQDFIGNNNADLTTNGLLAQGYTETAGWTNRFTSQLTSYFYPDDEYVLRNGTGEYLQSGDNQALFDPPDESANGWPARYLNYYYNTKRNFLSPAVGLILQCEGSSCNAGTDDNVLISRYSGYVTPETSIAWGDSSSMQGAGGFIYTLTNNTDEYYKYHMLGSGAYYANQAFVGRFGTYSTYQRSSIYGMGIRCSVQIK